MYNFYDVFREAVNAEKSMGASGQNLVCRLRYFALYLEYTMV